jgi:DNA-directed RNA polymerase subunit RPC12/RpoP
MEQKLSEKKTTSFCCPICGKVITVSYDKKIDIVCEQCNSKFFFSVVKESDINFTTDLSKG